MVPSAGYRRIYPDLPGMGSSTADGLICNDDVVALLVDFIDHLGAGPVMLLGHSYGAYLARGVAAQRPDMVLGLALLCPVAERSGSVPDHNVVRQNADAYDEPEAGQGGVRRVFRGALMHERPELLAALIGDWLDRAHPGNK
jgi:pimeloyl-ACP methyl ester carboxylesterase